MGKTVVLYVSVYGSTKEYATYIGKALGAEVLEAKGKIDLAPYDTIVFGGGLYAEALNGKDWLADHESVLCEKQLVVFATGMLDPKIPENFKRLEGNVGNSLPQGLKDVKIFGLRGRLDYKKLKVTHKGMMAVMIQFLKRKKNQTPEELELIASYGKMMDFVDLATADEIVAYVK